MNPKIPKIREEISRNRKKISAPQAQNRDLEKHLREPMLLTNEDIDTLLGLLFRSSFTQQRLEEMIAARKAAPAEAGDAVDAAPESAESSDP